MPNYKKIYFRLFGTFDITVNKKSVLTKGIRQQGFNKLLVYFLLNQGRVFEINTLIDKVWPNKEYQDNNSIMRTRIFRLKRQLAELVPSFEFSLEFTHGGYCFKYDPKNVVIDTDIFDNICSKIFTSRQAKLINADSGGFDAEARAGRARDPENRQSPSQAIANQPVLQARNPLSAPAVGIFTQGRTDRMISKSGDSYSQRTQYSDNELIKLCSDALRIYQNGFLNETAFDGSWLESYRQNYKRMWLEVVKTYAELCGKTQKFNEIITLCQEVLRFEDSEEYIHELYMDTLRKAGYHQDALRHYEIITSMSGQGEHIFNSQKLRDLQKSIIREVDNNQLVDENELEQVISGLTDDGNAVVYERDVFLKHCSVLRLHSKRDVYRPYICIIETLGYNSDDVLLKRLSNISYLTHIARNVFRKSDILCEWNDRQVLVLMACNQNFGADKLTHRIKMAILLDNLTPDEEANGELNLTERRYYLPVNVRFMPIGEVA